MKKTSGESGARMMRGNRSALQDTISCLLFVLIVFLCQYCLYFNVSRWMYMFNLIFISTDAITQKNVKLSKGKSKKQMF